MPFQPDPVQVGSSGAAVLPYLQYGYQDPTMMATAGQPGGLFLQLVQTLNAAPGAVGLFMKTLTSDTDTNWQNISGGGGGGANIALPNVYWVAQNGNDAPAPTRGRITDPFLTIGAAINQAVTDGHNGNNPANVFVMPSQSQHPAFQAKDGINVAAISTTEHSVFASNVDVQPDGTNEGGTISGITFNGADQLATSFQVATAPWTFHNCSLLGSDPASNAVAMGSAGSSFTFDNCLITQNQNIATVNLGAGTIIFKNGTVVDNFGGAPSLIGPAGGFVVARDTFFHSRAAGIFAIDSAGNLDIQDCNIGLPPDAGDGIAIRNGGGATIVDTPIWAATTAIQLDLGGSLFRRNISFTNVNVQVIQGFEQVLDGTESLTPFFVYKPGAANNQEKNIYNNWGDLSFALSITLGPKVVFIDDTLVSPAVLAAQAYDFTDITLDNGNPLRQAALSFADGAVVTNLNNIKNLSVQFHNTAVPVVSEAAQVVINLQNSTLLNTGTQPVWDFSASVCVFKLLELVNLVGGAGPIAMIEPGQTLQFNLLSRSSIQANSVVGDATTTLVVHFDDSSNFVAQAGALGVVTTILDSEAERVLYAPGTPGNWPVPPTQVAQALDELAGSNVNGLQSFVFQPGGGAGGNIYTTWPSLFAAISVATGPRVLEFDDTFVTPAVIPAGSPPLDCRDIYLIGKGLGSPTFVNIAVGASALANVFSISRALTIVDQQGGSFTHPAAPAATIEISDFSSVQATVSAAIIGQAGMVIVLKNNSALGTRAYQPSSPGVQVSLFERSAINNNALVGAVSIEARSDASGFISATQTLYTGVLTTVFVDTANKVAYAPAVPGDWTVPPTQVAQALDELAATVGAGAVTQSIVGTHAAPINVTGVTTIPFTSTTTFTKLYIFATVPVNMNGVPNIQAGSADGQRLLIDNAGAQNITIPGTSGVELNGAIVLVPEDQIELSWDGANWNEISRKQ